MITIKTFVFNPFQENTYILHDETGEAVIIDAGCYAQSERDKLQAYLKDNNLTLKRLLNTHSHIDHILGNQFIVDDFNLELESHKDDEFLIERAKDQAAAFGITIESTPLPKKYLNEGDQIKFGNSVLDIIHAPGHSAGSIVFYNKDEKFMIVGDVLFNQSIGRTDLPGGDYDTLISSIKNKLFPLGDEMEVYCGHGSNTTIGQERISNPFL